MSKPTRRYSDDERVAALAALAANDGNVQRTARDLDIPETTLRQWSKGERHPEASQMSDQKKAPLADIFEQVAYRCLDGLTDAKIKKMGGVDLLKTAGISVDKMRLLRDQPTSITRTSFSDLSDDALDREIERLQREIGDGAGGEAAPPESPPVEALPRPADAGDQPPSG